MKKLMTAASAVLAALLGAELTREFVSFRMTYYDISSDRLRTGDRERRILFLSDLHNRTYGKDNRRLLDAVRREEPELILIGGDMLVRREGAGYRRTAEFVKALAGICPVYCANGNHEQGLKAKPEKYGQDFFAYRAELMRAGVHFLENESAEVRLGDCRLRLTGLEIPLSCYTRTCKRALSREEIEACVGEPAEEEYQVLLAHDPSYMEQYFAWRADLVLSGHFHGGVVGIPGIGGLISPSLGLFPEYSGGIYHRGEKTAVVSRGIGSHTIPVRFLNPAEVIVLRVRK